MHRDSNKTAELSLQASRARTADGAAIARNAAATVSRFQPSGGDVPVEPRLLNMRQAAAYLGLSYWSLRDYVLAGLIPVVEFPPLRPREGDRARKTLRRVLVDREDLDRFIESRKSAGERDIQSRVRPIEARISRGNRTSVPGLCPPSGNDRDGQ